MRPQPALTLTLILALILTLIQDTNALVFSGLVAAIGLSVRLRLRVRG